MELLTKIELWKLRGEICLGSLYVSDYENSKWFNSYLLSQFFDGFLNEVSEEITELFGDEFFFDKLDEYDNQDRLYEYYESLEIECLKCLFVKEEN